MLELSWGSKFIDNRSRALFLSIPAVTGEVIQAKSGLDAFTWGFMSTQDTLATRHCSSVPYTKASYRVTMASQYHRTASYCSTIACCVMFAWISMLASHRPLVPHDEPSESSSGPLLFYNGLLIPPNCVVAPNSLRCLQSLEKWQAEIRTNSHLLGD